MSYQTFVANAQLSSNQMNTLQQSVYTRPKATVSSLTYTLLAADAGKSIEFTNAGSVVVTIPNSSSFDFTVGTTFHLLNAGTGTVTVGGASGVTVNSEGNLLTLATQWSSAELVKISTNGWVLSSKSSKVQTAELDDLSVTTAKIADSAVTSAKIENDTIINADIKSNAAIELGKLADATIDIKTANYSLVLTDKNKFIKMESASNRTITVPLQSTVNFPEGSQIHLIRYGSGTVEVVGETGAVILYKTPGAFLRATYSSATLLKCAATNTWMLMGDLSAS